MHSFNIEKQDTEYDKIHDMFKASLLIATNAPKIEVVKIERIQNPRLYQLYQAKKQTMNNGGNELLLYHGTTKDAVDKINCTGFNRSFCGKNGKQNTSLQSVENFCQPFSHQQLNLIATVGLIIIPYPITTNRPF